MTNKKYILKGKEIIEADLMTWASFFESPERIIKQENLPNGLRVSTVFLGLDHNFGEGEPLLFESMVFGLDEEKYGEIQMRYSTYEQAEEGHKKLVEKYKDMNTEKNKTCNQCLLKTLVYHGKDRYYCNDPKCPNFALLQVPVEDLSQEKI